MQHLTQAIVGKKNHMQRHEKEVAEWCSISSEAFGKLCHLNHFDLIVKENMCNVHRIKYITRLWYYTVLQKEKIYHKTWKVVPCFCMPFGGGAT